MDTDISMEQCSTCPCPERQKISSICFDIPLPSSQSSFRRATLSIPMPTDTINFKMLSNPMPASEYSSAGTSSLPTFAVNPFSSLWFLPFQWILLRRLDLGELGEAGVIHRENCFFSRLWPWVVSVVIASGITSFHHQKMAIKIFDKVGAIIRSVSNYTA